MSELDDSHFPDAPWTQWKEADVLLLHLVV